MNETNVTPAADNAPVAAEPKRGRGRPKVYTGALLAYVIGVVNAIAAQFPGQGLTKAHALLTHTGAVRNAYAKKYGVDMAKIAADAGLTDGPAYLPKISMVTLCHECQRVGIQLKRGRPKLAKAS